LVDLDHHRLRDQKIASDFGHQGGGKYAGRWNWNRTESRRDPKTGRRRRFEKP